MKRKLENLEPNSAKKAQVTSDNNFKLEVKREGVLEQFITWTNQLCSSSLKSQTVFSTVSINELRESLPDFPSLKSFINRIRYKNYNQAMEYLLTNLFRDELYFKKIIKNIDNLIELLKMVHSPKARPCRQMLYRKLDFNVIQNLLSQEPHKKEALTACVSQIVPSPTYKKDTQGTLLSRPKPRNQVPGQNPGSHIEKVVMPTMQQNQYAFFQINHAFFYSRPQQLLNQQDDSIPKITRFDNNNYSSQRLFFPNANTAYGANRRPTTTAMMAITELTEAELETLNKSPV